MNFDCTSELVSFDRSFAVVNSVYEDDAEKLHSDLIGINTEQQDLQIMKGNILDKDELDAMMTLHGDQLLQKKRQDSSVLQQRATFPVQEV
jgi:hypothetical protein